MVFILKHSFQTGVVVLLSICFDIGFVKAEKKVFSFSIFAKYECIEDGRKKFQTISKFVFLRMQNLLISRITYWI